MKKLFLPALFLILSTSLFSENVSAREISDYLYEKNIIIPLVQKQTTIGINLDETVLKHTNPKKFRDINIFDNDNNTVPFRIYSEPAQKVETPKVIEVSSNKKGKPEYLVDGDILTTFSFDPKEEGPVSFTLDLGEPMQVTRVNIFEDQIKKRVKQIQITGGLRKDKLKTIVSKRAFDWQFDFNSPTIRFLQISLWGTRGINISNTRIFRNTKAKVFFEALPGKRYKILYGNPTLDSILYTVLDKEEKAQKEVTLSKQDINPLFPEDFDKDGINNDLDNCPFVSNPMQRDSDEDRIGNDCDNAPKNKNANQYDIDQDGIGDVIDNCKLIANPDQKNKDKDQYGDACDNAFENETSGNNINITPVSTGSLILLIIVLLFIFHQAKKAKKKKK